MQGALMTAGTTPLQVLTCRSLGTTLTGNMIVIIAGALDGINDPKTEIVLNCLTNGIRDFESVMLHIFMKCESDNA